MTGKPEVTGKEPPKFLFADQPETIPFLDPCAFIAGNL
jgi:hypothetical protein